MIPRDVLELWVLFLLSVIESKYVYGFPGRRDSLTTYTMDVPGRAGYIYVRIWRGQELTLDMALNLGGIPNPNVLVRMERRNGRLVVKEADPGHALSALGENVSMANVPKHRHFIGSGMEDSVEGRRIEPGLLAPSETVGLNVRIFPFHHPGGYFPGDLDFLIDDPASNFAAVGVYVDISTNTAGYLVGITHTSPLEITDEDLFVDLAAHPVGIIPCGAVIIQAGQTDIDANDTFLDWRFHLDGDAAFSVDVGGVATVTPVLGDKPLFFDASDSDKLKRSTWQLIYDLINTLTAETAPAVGDKVAAYDASGAATDSMTLAVLFSIISQFTTTTLALDDTIVANDTSASNAAIKNTFQAVFNLINLLTQETVPELSDKIPLYDISANNADYVTLTNLFKLVPVEITTTSTGNIDDFAIGTAPITLLRMNNASDATLRGMAAGVGGQKVTIVSVGAGNVYLAHENAGSTAANRLNNTGFVTGIDMPLAAGAGRATYVYDDTADGWRLISHEQGAYIAYTVAWTGSVSDPSLENGTLTGSYKIVGIHVHTTLRLVVGSTTTFGSGQWRFSVPSTIVNNTLVISGYAFDSSAVLFYLALANPGTATAVKFFSDVTGVITATVPFTWATSDILEAGGYYIGA